MSIVRKEQPIGVFDSGFGGLTILKAIREQLPFEDFVYLGDTARVPYGTRSRETVIRYAQSCARFLAQQHVKCLVVACNTVSAVALDVLAASLDVTVLGVINPGARAAVEVCPAGRIGVVATAGTVASHAYVRAVGACDTRAEVVSQPAPLWVPLVEEGWIDGPVPLLAVDRYLAPLLARKIDVLLLGCTHYPVLKPVIEQYLAEQHYMIPVVDGGRPVATELGGMLALHDLLQNQTRKGNIQVLVTDMPSQFDMLMQRFMGHALSKNQVRQVDLV
ncbi:MAG: glutamate racemase [Myxococcales bacterium]|nr:glutamate racemase [Myxococcales bacterium]MCB9707171.1 glutamate racemase [Myxococcales bacterium]